MVLADVNPNGRTWGAGIDDREQVVARRCEDGARRRVSGHEILAAAGRGRRRGREDEHALVHGVGVRHERRGVQMQANGRWCIRRDLDGHLERLAVFRVGVVDGDDLRAAEVVASAEVVRAVLLDAELRRVHHAGEVVLEVGVASRD